NRDHGLRVRDDRAPATAGADPPLERATDEDHACRGARPWNAVQWVVGGYAGRRESHLVARYFRAQYRPAGEVHRHGRRAALTPTPAVAANARHRRELSREAEQAIRVALGLSGPAPGTGGDRRA